MVSDELRQVAEALGESAVAARVLAGGFSHETSLLTLGSGQVVVRFGGADHGIEAAVMDAARAHVPVPQVLKVLDAGSLGAGARSAMVLEYVNGTPLSQVLDGAENDAATDAETDAGELERLGAEVGRVAARLGAVRFGHPGFFADARLSVAPGPPWSQQLPEFAAQCMTATPEERLDAATRTAWAELCSIHAQALVGVDDQARLVHADLNPKNILVTRAHGGWRVDAILDWEFDFSGSPYADAANMVRFRADTPGAYRAGFRAAFADHLPADLRSGEDWLYLGRVMDMFALSDLVTRPVGHRVADQAAQEIRRWVAHGVPDSW
ncbi:phosphotransferase family protein [Catenulispora rubra]|uniref:phosphotransferase family protein n=1 Tax=Catenulispora rubra TaxID=280293 RepID=UPI001892503D|nr:phosphotransferase [Catenulispora rubra]